MRISRYVMTLAAMLAVGCVEATPMAVPELDEVSPSPEPTTVDPMPVEEEEAAVDPEPVSYVDEIPDCVDGEDLSAVFIGYDAAAGSRYHWVRVRNCSSDLITLPEPVFGGVDRAGVAHDLTTETHLDPPDALAPGTTALLELKWLSNGRCERGIQELSMVVGNQTFVSPETCLQLGGDHAPERDADITYVWHQE